MAFPSSFRLHVLMRKLQLHYMDFCVSTEAQKTISMQMQLKMANADSIFLKHRENANTKLNANLQLWNNITFFPTFSIQQRCFCSESGPLIKVCTNDAIFHL